MNRLICLALCLMSAAATVHAGPDERARWQSEARNTKIVRDNWGIAHVYGKSDADAVFGSLYAQAEDDLAAL
jgi:acyl-homoserine-lactone acylase